MVLALAAFLTVPHQSVPSLSIGFGVCGGAGLIYVGNIAAEMRGIRRHYVPVREDWIWNAIAPAAVYGALVAASVLVWHWVELGLYVVAGAATSLLFIGIRNAWDVAVWNSSNRQENSP
jgi:hypothetical protein